MSWLSYQILFNEEEKNEDNDDSLYYEVHELDMADNEFHVSTRGDFVKRVIAFDLDNLQPEVCRSSKYHSYTYLREKSTITFKHYNKNVYYTDDTGGLDGLVIKCNASKMYALYGLTCSKRAKAAYRSPFKFKIPTKEEYEAAFLKPVIIPNGKHVMPPVYGGTYKFVDEICIPEKNAVIYVIEMIPKKKNGESYKVKDAHLFNVLISAHNIQMDVSKYMVNVNRALMGIPLLDDEDELVFLSNHHPIEGYSRSLPLFHWRDFRLSCESTSDQYDHCDAILTVSDLDRDYVRRCIAADRKKTLDEMKHRDEIDIAKVLDEIDSGKYGHH